MHLECWKIIGHGYHFGQHGLGQEVTAITFSSDSLFAALVARLAESAGSQAVDEWVQPFNSGDPPFILSSTFPLAGEVRFFPTPLSALQQDARASAPATERSKDLKKVKFISEGIFRRWLAGESLAEQYPTGHLLQSKSVLAAAGEIAVLPVGLQVPGASIWSEEKRPRVTLGRSVQNSDIFFTGRVNFAEHCGLWFGVWWRSTEPALKQRFANLVSELADAGLGAERSIGFGQCQITGQGDLELPEAGKNTWLTLSRYAPRPDELAALHDPAAAYSLKRVGGWLVSRSSSGQRRRLVHLIVEGSVFGPLNRSTPGHLVDVRPSYPSDPDPIGHAVYRNGFALPVGIPQGGLDE